jgi:hypothetical protein
MPDCGSGAGDTSRTWFRPVVAVAEPLVWVCRVWERRPKSTVVPVDAITQQIVWRNVEAIDKHTGYSPEGDVDDVILEPAAIRETSQIAGDYAQGVGIGAR